MSRCHLRSRRLQALRDRRILPRMKEGDAGAKVLEIGEQGNTSLVGGFCQDGPGGEEGFVACQSAEDVEMHEVEENVVGRERENKVGACTRI